MLEEHRSGPDADAYRHALRRHPAGVVVVTATGPDGRLGGLTVTSLVSLSLDPPLVSFNVATSASAYDVIMRCRTFAVNFLAADQAGIAIRFATRGVDRFAPPTRWATLPGGEPVLLDAPAHLRCEVVDRIMAGDHTLLIGRVLESVVERRHTPLVYHEGHYSSVRAGRPTWWRRWRRQRVRHEG